MLEARVIAAMRAWRRGCGPLQPWFRATPFAAAFHYPERLVSLRASAAIPAAAASILTRLPRPRRDTLWILDVPGPLALWTAFALRRRHGMAAALCFNGWYDPRGILDGRAEIPLLMGLAGRLAPRTRAGLGCLVFDAGRATAPGADPAGVLDNRYELGEEDAPSREQLRAAGWRRVAAFCAGAPAADLAPYLEYLGAEMAVETHAVAVPADQVAAHA